MIEQDELYNEEEEGNEGLTPQEYFKGLKNRDQEAYNNWAKTKSKKDLGILINSLAGPIYAEVRRTSGSLPTAALAAEAKSWAFKAIQSYDPSKGTSISTHVINYLPKTRRLNYKFQNAVRLPENMQLKYHEYNKELTGLTEELNREPTDEELAHRLGWSKPQTVKFKNSLYADLIESNSERPGEFTKFNENAILMEHLMSQLDAQEKFILENSKVLSSTELATKLGVNLNRLNYLKAKLIDKIKKIKQETGMY
jgi:DNA-directed RNA polymerase specialized sigma subunit